MFQNAIQIPSIWALFSSSLQRVQHSFPGGRTQGPMEFSWPIYNLLVFWVMTSQEKHIHSIIKYLSMCPRNYLQCLQRYTFPVLGGSGLQSLQASVETRRKDEGRRTLKKVEKRPREPMGVIMTQHTPVLSPNWSHALLPNLRQRKNSVTQDDPWG